MARWMITTWVGGLMILSGCTAGASLQVPLKYTPSDTLQAGEYIINAKSKIYISGVIDERPDKTLIGQSTRRAGNLPVYPYEDSKVTPCVFIQDVFAKELKDVGVEVVPDPTLANRVLSIKLNQFFVVEDRLYRGEIAGEAAVEDLHGRALWRGQIAGSSRKFGAELSPEGYQKTLSDSMLNLISKLLSNPGFQKALY